MRSFGLLPAVVIVLIALSGCRMNNGDIGLLYGVWAVTDVEVNGEPYHGWQSNGYNESFFQFQNNIVFVTRTNSLYDHEDQAGTWEWLKEDTRIALNFTHRDNLNDTPRPGGYMYGAPAWLLLVEPVIYNFDVEWTDDKHTVWTTVNTSGQRLTYHLKKTY